MAQGSTAGLQSLIRKLQEGLASEDVFPVHQTHIAITSRYGRSYTGKFSSFHMSSFAKSHVLWHMRELKSELKLFAYHLHWLTIF